MTDSSPSRGPEVPPQPPLTFIPQGGGFGATPGGLPDLAVTFAVAMAAGPFLQAMATHFGSRLAGAIDEATRTALRRFLRREAAERSGTSAAPINLRTDHGWRVTFDPDTPAEALAQLLDIHTATAPPLATEPEPRLTWQQPGPGWQLVGVESGTLVLRAWDPAAKCWGDPRS